MLEQCTFISHRSGGWKSEIMVLADSVPSESPLPGSRRAVFSLGPQMEEGVRELSEVYWGIGPLREAPPS